MNIKRNHLTAHELQCASSDAGRQETVLALAYLAAIRSACYRIFLHFGMRIIWMCAVNAHKTLVQLAFTVLSRAFQVTFDRKCVFLSPCCHVLLSCIPMTPLARFGDAGFVIYWMLAWCSMMALGFAVESMLTLLTPRFIPFFLVIWIIVNVSVVIFRECPPSQLRSMA